VISMAAQGRELSVVLGLCAFTHDSAAALLVDGELVGFVEEERLSGVKHTSAYPLHAVEWLLGEAGIKPGDVQEVAYSFDGRRYLAAVPGSARFLLSPSAYRRAVPRAASFAKVARRCARRMGLLSARFPNASVRPVLHHRAHGLYAFAASDYADAAVLIVDSLGETQTTTIADACQTDRHPAYRIVKALHDPASLGYAYGAITQHLGWRRGDEEGTVMALAALGDPARFRELFRRAIRLTDAGFALDPRLLPLRLLTRGYRRTSAAFDRAVCPPRTAADPVEQVHRDVAAALQERTEQVMLHLARRARSLTGKHRLCMGGGVATNCVAIGKIAEAGIFDEVFVPPAPGDAGTAIGAAISAHLEGSPLPLYEVPGAYLGPGYPDLILDSEPRPGLRARRVSDPVHLLAGQLAAGRIVGVFHGRVEAGPRALGNRSILASPLRRGVVDRLNASVKFRETFRPYAPAVLAERAGEYFTLSQDAPFMSMASGVTDLARAQIPAIVHVNGTARLQTVTKQQNPFLAAVLEAFAACTGVPVLINTSLNVKGRPICGTPDMALDCLASSGLDALLIEGWWVTK
jgi:carbamoyltransferase